MFEEIQLWRYLYHRHIVLLFEVIDDPEDDGIQYVMEYMPYGPVMRAIPDSNNTFAYYKYFLDTLPPAAVNSLYDGIPNTTLYPLTSSLSPRMNESNACIHYYELLQGLSYLHERHICHRDIKPDNLLINDRHLLCISDFNCAIQLDVTDSVGIMNDTVGTPAFWCPESLRVEREGIFIDPSSYEESEAEPPIISYSAFNAGIIVYWCVIVYV